ncbi:MAG: Abi family protein, partial [Mycoplasmataceae bacterium]|nr:Abi family protein [Mycoplasmataceae bacterium]
INLPFILLDDKFSKDIALKLFVNNLSKESFFDENNEFDFKSYFNFVIRYINPFDTFNSYSINMDVKKFYFHKILKNNIQLKLERKILKQQFDEFNRNGSVSDSLLLQIENELNNKKIDCSFIQLFNYLNEKELKNIKDNSVRTNIVIDNGINILSKSFIPLYKSLTQQSFGDLINFFCKLNENIQIKIIKKHFSCFYKKIYKLQNQSNKFSLILISSFISFLMLFKNLRNKIAHCDIIYNFWDIYTPICNNNQRRVKSKKKDFWLLNKDSCIFLNNILNNKKEKIFI